MSATSSEAGKLSAIRPHLIGVKDSQLVQRTDHAAHRASGNLGVQRGRLELGVAKQHLDHPHIDAVFQQMGRKAIRLYIFGQYVLAVC